MEKAPEAFRIISEVASELDVPQHVLRFWESRFNQIRPMKRGGGRRYYRPDDIDLLRGIRHLLYSEGYTIRGVQRLLREQGVGFVQTVWQVEGAQSQADEVNGEPESSEATARDRLLLGLLPKFGRPRNAAQAAELDITEESEADDILNVDSGDDPKEPEPLAAPEKTASAPARLPREQLKELQSALDELGECRRLIDTALASRE